MSVPTCIYLVVVSLVLPLVATQELCITPNDGYEVFIQSIPENTPNGTELGVVPIVGDETQVELRAQAHNVLVFNVSTRSVILSGEFDTDRDSPELPALVIECTEKNSLDVRTIEITVRVLLTDWNDNPPIFNTVHHTVWVPEDTLVNTVIYSEAVATDNDKEFTPNSRITYTIVQGTNYSEYFRIAAPSKPTITLAKSLDYERVKVMTVQIRASDNPGPAMPRLSATATLTVSVTDADDQNPEFTRKAYTASISEDATPGSLVDVRHPIKAVDPDSMNATIEYKLLDPYDIFAINVTTAAVYTLKQLYVDVPTVTVVVIAYQTDNPSREWFAMVTIAITKANINAPKFSRQTYHVTKLEAEPVNSTLVTCTATDPDFGTIIYYAIKGNVRDFEINEFGNVILSQPLDYEREQLRIINVTATDGTYTATATVKISILDVNDNNPVITTQGKRFLRDRENGLLVTKVTGTDADVNSTVTFHLGSHQNLFKINEVGEIHISGHPETLGEDSYTLIVIVRDDGEPPREASTTIEVIFPTDGFTVRPTERAEALVVREEDNMLTIILGAVAGVLLVIVLILVVYIIWRNKRVKEELDRARAPPRGPGPQGLTYRSAEAPDDLPRMDLHYGVDDVDAISDAGYDVDVGTTVQQNPLSDAAVNQGYLQSSGSEMDRDVSEIEVETAVIPYEDDYGYGSAASSRHNTGQLRTFQGGAGVGDDSTSSGSSHSDSTHGSRRVLVNNEASQDGKGKMTTWDSDDQIHPQGSQKLLDPNTAVTPAKTKKEKPEITVYF